MVLNVQIGRDTDGNFQYFVSKQVQPLSEENFIKFLHSSMFETKQTFSKLTFLDFDFVEVFNDPEKFEEKMENPFCYIYVKDENEMLALFDYLKYCGRENDYPQRVNVPIEEIKFPALLMRPTVISENGRSYEITQFWYVIDNLDFVKNSIDELLML